MHRDGPFTRMPEVATPPIRQGLLVFLILLFAVAFCTSRAIADPPQQGSPAQAKSGQAAPASDEYVGQDTCAGCHEEVVKGFATNPHTRLAEMHGKTGVNCESCHGPGKAHVDGGGDVAKIFNPAKATAKEVDAKCLSCHRGQHSNFEHTAHGEGNVSCLGCHNIHKAAETGPLLKATQPTLCFECHTDVKPEFNMPFHHKVEEGLITCSDCHDPHGTFNRKNLRASTQQDAVCTKCHVETAGPFVYEHAVVKTEGCVACHFPHGGPNPRLLNRANVNTICLQCHSPSPNFTTSQPLGPAHNQAVQYQSCTICHTEVHGSNISAVFFATQ